MYALIAAGLLLSSSFHIHYASQGEEETTMAAMIQLKERVKYPILQHDQFVELCCICQCYKPTYAHFCAEETQKVTS